MTKILFITSKLYQIVALIGIIFIFSTHIVAATSETRVPTLEYKIKATYLLNFIKYIEWPEQSHPISQGSFIIAILGDDRFGEATNFFTDKTINGRSVVIRKFKNVDELENCHILFVSSSERKNEKRIIKLVRGKGILTIGESDTFIKRGGIIEFLLSRAKVNFRINLSIAKKEGFIFSSKLLRIAKEIKGI